MSHRNVADICVTCHTCPQKKCDLHQCDRHPCDMSNMTNRNVADHLFFRIGFLSLKGDSLRDRK